MVERVDFKISECACSMEGALGGRKDELGRAQIQLVGLHLYIELYLFIPYINYI